MCARLPVVPGDDARVSHVCGGYVYVEAFVESRWTLVAKFAHVDWPPGIEIEGVDLAFGAPRYDAVVLRVTPRPGTCAEDVPFDPFS